MADICEANAADPDQDNAINDLREQNETQARAIRELWVKFTAIEKRNDHAQAYIAKLKARLAALESQVTDEAKADWFFTNRADNTQVIE